MNALEITAALKSLAVLRTGPEAKSPIVQQHHAPAPCANVTGKQQPVNPAVEANEARTTTKNAKGGTLRCKSQSEPNMKVANLELKARGVEARATGMQTVSEQQPPSTAELQRPPQKDIEAGRSQSYCPSTA